jgi:predicted enzyme related to lactoylglutathione lyase
MGFRMLSTNAPYRIGGGIWPAPPEATGFVQLFLGTDDVAAAVEAAQKLGATVEVPPTKAVAGRRGNVARSAGDAVRIVEAELTIHEMEKLRIACG